MGIIRNSASALRTLTLKDRHYGSLSKRRFLAHVSQTMLKVEQPAVSRQTSKDPVLTWLLPATLALLGLSISTFCTHQLVSTGQPLQSRKAFVPSSDSNVICTEKEPSDQK